VNKTARGFSLIELITVLVLMGIMGVVALGSLNGGGYAERAFYDEFRSALRYAQKRAVATGCPVQVSIGSQSYALFQGQASCADSTYTRAVMQPFNLGQAYSNTSAQASISPTTNVLFDAAGRPGIATTLYSVGARSVTVYSSGLVQ